MRLMDLYVIFRNGAKYYLSYNFVEHYFTLGIKWFSQRPDTLNLDSLSRMVRHTCTFHHGSHAIAWNKLELIDVLELCDALDLMVAPIAADDIVEGFRNFVTKLKAE